MPCRQVYALASVCHALIRQGAIIAARWASRDAFSLFSCSLSELLMRYARAASSYASALASVDSVFESAAKASAADVMECWIVPYDSESSLKFKAFEAKRRHKPAIHGN